MNNKYEEQENRLLWENHTWDSSNLCDSGEKTKENPIDSSINNPIDIENEEGMIGKKRGKKGVSNSKGSKRSSKEGRGCGESEHEIHIWTERERRKKMRSMFSNLHALLPKLPPKADKSTIVDEAVNYIKTLQQTLLTLQNQKLEKTQTNTIFGYDSSFINPQNLPDSREAFFAEQGSSNSMLISSAKSSNISSILKYPVLFRTWTSQNVVLNICGEEAHISICSSKKPGLFASICYVLKKHNIEVLSAHVSSDSSRSLFMIQAYHASRDSDQFGESLVPLEELYRRAVSEIMCWVSS